MALNDDIPIKIGVLRLEIQGRWSAKEFSQLLDNTREAYLLCNVIDFSPRLLKGKRIRRKCLTISTAFFPTPFFEPDPNSKAREGRVIGTAESLEFLVSVAKSRTADLYVKGIQYTSPGWIDLIASLNPLKVIAESIDNWRKVNLERDKITHDTELERMRIQAQQETEKLRIQSELAKVLIQNAGSLLGARSGPRFERVLQSVLNPTERIVAEIAKDDRIVNARLLSPASDQTPNATGKAGAGQTSAGSAGA